MSQQDLSKRFKRDFTFGVATAAYQIEGAAEEDGRKPSIWDAFSHTPGRTRDGDTGDVACDHYHRYAEDIALMASLGVDAYRFSFAWPRIIPDGRGAVNDKGVAFYDRLLDGILKAGIKPFATFYHWDLPIELLGRGGWCARETAFAFADFVDVLMRRFGDRLAGAVTINEPWCVSYLSYLYGEHAPGERNLQAALAAVHHLNLAHGLAVETVRSHRGDLPVGIVFNAKAIHAASERPEDLAAAERHEAFHNGVFAEPIFAGRYPASVVEALGPLMPKIESGDLATISRPTDFLGINYYTPDRVAADPAQAFPSTRHVAPENVWRTAMGWEVHAPSLALLIRDMNRRYRLPPLYITENGCALHDELRDGRVDDPDRIAYLEQHLTVIADLIDEGYDVRGYFAWSLMDNFEWAWGYARRFGLVYVDYESQKRIVKASGRWFRDLIAGRATAR